MKPESVKKVENLAKEYGIEYEIIPHCLSGKTTDDAERALGVPKRNILKSLLLKGGEEYYATIISGEDRLDFKKISELTDTNCKKIRMANKEEVESFTNYFIGSVPSIIFKDLCTTYVDKNVMNKDYVIGAGGSEFYGFKIKPEEFIKLGYNIADIS